MADTFHQVYIQLIFAVKGRRSLLKKEFRQEFFKVMASMIQDLGHKSIIVNGVADHVHCFIGLHPDKTISDLAEKLKTLSNHFLKDKKWADGRFSWQRGYGAFSYSRSHMEIMYQYIANQEVHHQKVTFKEEYMGLLRKFEIEFKDEYLFEFLDDV